ncbi:MAG: hypothetical protein H7A46_12010 [Verrucomicrobiales bacterium]|nr:hypothetical protein [Verrucomicrobiales bacterium]
MIACRSRLLTRLPAWGVTLMLAAGAAHACKYNVRDAGFVDFEPAPYRLVVVTNETTSVAWCEQLRHVAAVELLDSNVELLLSPKEPGETRMGTDWHGFRENRADGQTHSSRPGDEPVEHGLERVTPGDSPGDFAVLLLGPDGRRLRRPLPSEPDQAAAWSLVEAVTTSPLRQRLLENLVTHFAVILVARGEDAAGNDRARQAAEGAVERFEDRMPRLPKPVKSPPLVLTISRGNPEPGGRTTADVTATDVDWWALSLDEGRPDEAQAVVLYGRGRRSGPVLRGADVTETALLEVLTVLGQDCECDLDRSWLRGPLLPLAWEEAQQTEVVKELGFDAENPMVKAEISRIVARGPGTGAQRVRFDEAGSGFAELGYSEVALAEVPGETGTPLASNAVEGETPLTQNTNRPVAAKGAITTAPAQPPVARMSWMIIALAAAVVLGVALVFLFSGRSD